MESVALTLDLFVMVPLSSVNEVFREEHCVFFSFKGYNENSDI